MIQFLENCIDNQLIPADLISLFDDLCVFYDGCIVVEIHDFRRMSKQANANLPNRKSAKNTPEIRRVLLKPTYQSLLNDIAQLKHTNGWSTEFELQFEQKA